jgi:membrane fusion protein (multidrug efflux system)
VYGSSRTARVERPTSRSARAARPARSAEGLKAGDRIVVDGTGKLRVGAKIAEIKPLSRAARREAG